MMESKAQGQAVPTEVNDGPQHAVAPASSDPKTTTAQVPSGYKLVKARKADGTIVTVKRKIKDGEDTASPSTAVTATAIKKGPTGASTGETAAEARKYKIVLVPQPDGTLRKFRRLIPEDNKGGPASTQPPKQVAPDVNTAKTGNTNSKAATASDEKSLETKPVDKTESSRSDQQQAQPPAITDVNSSIPTRESAAATDDVALQGALNEQKQRMRERKMHGFRSKLTRGLAVAIGSAIPAFEISEEHQDGDEELTDDDLSDDDDDIDNDHDHDDIESRDWNKDEHSGLHQGDDSAQQHTQNSESNVVFNGNAAVNNAVGAIAANASQPPPPRQAPQTTPENGHNKPVESGKATYKLTAKDVEELDEKASNIKPLKKHWANLTFYILASLSIVLPLLFLVLAIVIFLMNGKRVDSSWGTLEQVIKVAVSAWPIIFAAVVAQVFKTYATFKVERGIKLMELEQLVGSNSFASAVKQPILLRRVDLISLVLFVTWCLSPLGSSALQRTYSVDYQMINTTSTVYYLNMTGPNRVLSLQNQGVTLHGAYNVSLGDILEQMSILYMALFAPEGAASDPYEDAYNHPRAPWLNESVAINAPSSVSGYGVPLILSDSIFGRPGQQEDSYDPRHGDPRVEITNFIMRTSVFEFTCGSWYVVNGSYFDIPSSEISYNTSVPCYTLNNSTSSGDVAPSDDTANCTQTVTTSTHSSWEISSSNTSRIRFGYRDPTEPSSPVVNSLEFSSLIKGPGSTKSIGSSDWPLTGNLSTHSAIQCSFNEVFVEFGVACSRTAISDTAVAYCSYDQSFEEVRAIPVPAGAGANLVVPPFLQYTSPADGQQYSTTPNEIFLGLYMEEDKFDANGFNLSALVPADIFSDRMAYLFNTFVSLGNTFGAGSAKSYVADFDKTNLTADAADFVAVPDARWYRTGPRVYERDTAWAAVFLACVALLLAAGVASVAVESLTVAPDTLGYVSTVARNSRHLRLPKTKVSSAMSGGERAKALGETVVMMQDVNPDAGVGRIALGLKHERAKRLEPGRLYR